MDGSSRSTWVDSAFPRSHIIAILQSRHPQPLQGEDVNMTLETIDSLTFSKGKDLTHYLVSKIPLIFLKRKESRLFFTPWEAHAFCSAAPPGGHRCVRSQPLTVLGILKWGPWVLSSVSQSLGFPHRKTTTLLKISFRNQFSWFHWDEWGNDPMEGLKWGQRDVWQLYYCIRSGYTGLFAFRRRMLTYWMQHTFPST